MKTTKEKIEVMQAYEDGKAIQARSISTFGWFDADTPTWDWPRFDYRIKPEPKEPTYRPYQSVEELVEDFKARFHVDNPPYTMPLIWVRHKEDKSICLFTFFPQTKDIVGVLDTEFNFHEYLDGTPFGKLVKE